MTPKNAKTVILNYDWRQAEKLRMVVKCVEESLLPEKTTHGYVQCIHQCQCYIVMCRAIGGAPDMRSWSIEIRLVTNNVKARPPWTELMKKKKLNVNSFMFEPDHVLLVNLNQIPQTN